MVLALFLILSIPIGCLAAWFGWKAHGVGKKSVVYAMAWISFLCFGSALLFGSWGYLFATQG